MPPSMYPKDEFEYTQSLSIVPFYVSFVVMACYARLDSSHSFPSFESVNNYEYSVLYKITEVIKVQLFFVRKYCVNALYKKTSSSPLIMCGGRFLIYFQIVS